MKALSFGKGVVILGDLNCNLLTNCPEGNALNDLCATLNLRHNKKGIIKRIDKVSYTTVR